MVRQGRGGRGETLAGANDLLERGTQLREALNRNPWYRRYRRFSPLVPDLEPPRDLADTPGFNIEPINEPISPWDCNRYPDSPFCSPGSPVPWDPLDSSPTAPRLTSHGCNGCECWVCFGGELFGVAAPDTCISYRRANCREPEPEQPPPPPPRPPITEDRPEVPNPFLDGWIQGCQYFVFIGYEGTPVYPGGDGTWDRFGQFNGYIYPVYGPVVSVRSVITLYDGGEFYQMNVYLRCGGMGHFSGLEGGGRYGSVDQSRSYIAEFVDRASSRRPVFLLPGNVSHQIPVQEMWVEGPGVVPHPFEGPRYAGIGPHDYLVQFFNVSRRDGPEDPMPVPYIYDVRRAADIPPYYFRTRNRYYPWGNACADPVPPPPPHLPPRDSMCNCSDLSYLIDAKLRPIYRILGFTQTEYPTSTITPETLIKDLLSRTYVDNNPATAQVNNLGELNSAIASALFFRSGFHRFPANVPDSLTEDSRSGQTTLHDAASWQEWLFTQIDGLFGQYPVKIKYKNAEGEEKILNVANTAEIQAEMMGLLLSIAADTDVIQAMTMKASVEAMGARVAAITASDYAKANAEFLGYRGKETQRNVKLAFNPGANNLRDAIKESTKKIPKWEMDDSVDLQEFLKRLLLGVEIIKAVFQRPFNPTDNLPGEGIRADRDSNGQDDDQQWAEFVARLENPPGNQRDPNAPTPDVRNLADPTEPA